MSLHTILSQMEEEFDKKFSSIEVYADEHSQFYGVIIPQDIHENDEYTLNDIKKFFHSFATRIVEEARKEERAKKNKWAKEHPEKMAENHKRFREKRIRNGLCVDCGDIAVTMTLCEKHRLIAIERYNKRRPSYRR